mmetsp:Transcript_25538/g.64009  ORF Transcript_25538/g.64009 Transcript_25538/m.64009 type:complete len:205 (+) Transcript_25538:741-1355(+)
MRRASFTPQRTQADLRPTSHISNTGKHGLGGSNRNPRKRQLFFLTATFFPQARRVAFEWPNPKWGNRLFCVRCTNICPLLICCGKASIFTSKKVCLRALTCFEKPSVPSLRICIVPCADSPFSKKRRIKEEEERDKLRFGFDSTLVTFKPKTVRGPRKRLTETRSFGEHLNEIPSNPLHVVVGKSKTIIPRSCIPWRKLLLLRS